MRESSGKGRREIRSRAKKGVRSWVKAWGREGGREGGRKGEEKGVSPPIEMEEEIREKEKEGGREGEREGKTYVHESGGGEGTAEEDVYQAVHKLVLVRGHDHPRGREGGREGLVSASFGDSHWAKAKVMMTRREEGREGGREGGG